MAGSLDEYESTADSFVVSHTTNTRESAGRRVPRWLASTSGRADWDNAANMMLQKVDVSVSADGFQPVFFYWRDPLQVLQCLPTAG
jgi:hypothetical protein